MTGFPMLSRDLTDYPEALDEQPPEGKPSGTSLQMSALLRAAEAEPVTFACCKHCTFTDPHVVPHRTPCDHGCNDDIAPVETGEPWRGPAQADWDGSRDG
jgi:hypothetical protein